jgi:glyoxylase-like metal-dependent hydrolase (beta-lactamase superfamily II)/rhodanese-related sulfurtransferase
MYIKQIYTGCLAEAAYYLESNGEAAIIDPLRDVKEYIDLAEKRGAKIKYILETHFHADFVSGHLDLAKRTGAKIVYGPTAQPSFEAYIAEDNELLPLGKARLKVLHTPGHTMESSTFLAIDEEDKQIGIFTGDTLFIGDVGRPDLAVKTDLSREDLARHLYHSLHEKIMPLGDDLIVYPGHGQGSACGKNMSSETTDTLGNQKQTNYALDTSLSEAEFVKEITTGLVSPPQYFPKNAVLNKVGPSALSKIIEKGVQALSVDDFESYAQEENTLVLDTRHQNDFVKAHIPNSLYIGLHDNFAPWVGALIKDLKTPILFIADEGREEEVVVRLSRVGYDNPMGYLKGGFAAWLKADKPTAETPVLPLSQLEQEFDKLRPNLVDVRKKSEYDRQHLQGVANKPLDFMPDNLQELNAQQEYYVHCAGGYRSVIAASILERLGIKAQSIEGGFNEMVKKDVPLTEAQEVNNML